MPRPVSNCWRSPFDGRNGVDRPLGPRVILQNGEHDPAFVRSVAAALRRVDSLDKQTQHRIVTRLPQLTPTIEYLRPRGSSPSLVQEGIWSSVSGRKPRWLLDPASDDRIGYRRNPACTGEPP
jgi:hypothetical protein